ncbi:MAG: hypothetical protein ACPGVT_08700 [Maricaulaceae bacterium]
MNGFTENVRRRPGMYVGDTDSGLGLLHMAYAALDNLSGVAQNSVVYLSLLSPRRLRFFVPNIYVTENELFTWATEDGFSHKSEMGSETGALINWLPVANALSQSFKIEALSPQGAYGFTFSKGQVIQGGELSISENGLLVEFEACDEIFPAHLTFPQAALAGRLDELAALTGRKYHFDGQVFDYADVAAWLRQGILADHKVFAHKGYLGEAAQGIAIDIALMEGAVSITGYVNTVKTRGGVHVDGVKAVLGALQCGGQSLGGVVHVTHPRPEFRNPTRDVLANADIPDMIEAAIHEPLAAFLRRDAG